MALNWDDALLLGNAEIDEEHRQIFSHFERLALACQEGGDGEVQKNLLSCLEEYATRHFTHEEALMVLNGYPGLAEQQLQHAHFRRTVKELQALDMKNMDAHELSLLIYRRLVSWFARHIKGLDQKMVNYILAQQHY